MAKKDSGPREAPVDDYPERPYDEAKADPDEIKKIENRATEDQIKDYHKDNPTLEVDVPTDQKQDEPA